MSSKILTWAKKTSSIIILGVCLLVLSIFLFVGTLAEFVIEKYDEEWTGRRIEIDKMRINLFTGGINIHNLTLFEPSKVDTFAHVKHIYINLELTRFIKGEYDVKEIAINHPYVSVVQSGSSFNFDDLLNRFISTDSTNAQPSNAGPVHYRVENIHIDSARVYYNELAIQSKLTLLNLNAKCPLIAWNIPTHHYEFSADAASGGNLTTSIDLDINTLLYQLAADIKEISLIPFLPYVQDAMKVNKMEGRVSMNFFLKGDFNKPTAIAMRADNTLSDFKLIDFQNDTLVTAGLLTFGVDSVNTEGNIYEWGAFTLDQPYIKFELYTDGDNFTRLLKDTATAASVRDSVVVEDEYSNPFILLTRYANNIINDYVMQEYSIDSVLITGGRFVYNDYTLQDKFVSELDSLIMTSGRLNSVNSNLDFAIQSRINKTGRMKAHLSMDPHNLENFDLVYSVKDVRLSSFSPYSVYYVAHPFYDGLVYYDNETKVTNRVIDSKNKLEVRKIEVGKKVKNTTAFDMPIRLAVAILRDQHGNVNLDVPVEGNLDDPEYKLGKVIWGIIKNIIVKAATSPFKLLARAIDADEDDLKSIRFEYLSDSLSKKQQKNLSLLTRVLKQKPELKIELVYKPAHPDEAEMLAAYEAKKRYILKIDSTRDDVPTTAQLKQIEALSINDSAFVHYLDRRLLFEGSAPSIEKCKRFIGKRRLDNRMEAIINNRKKLVTDYLSNQEELKPESYEIVDAGENDISVGVPQFDVKFGMIDE